jgi:hypothetical protein
MYYLFYCVFLFVVWVKLVLTLASIKSLVPTLRVHIVHRKYINLQKIYFILFFTSNFLFYSFFFLLQFFFCQKSISIFLYFFIYKSLWSFINYYVINALKIKCKLQNFYLYKLIHFWNSKYLLCQNSLIKYQPNIFIKPIKDNLYDFLNQTNKRMWILISYKK